MSDGNNSAAKGKQQYSLNDDRRVRVLSPGMLVTKRFIRNKMAVTGLVVLIFMFVFSFIGGLISPYAEDERFYTMKETASLYAGAKENTEFRYITISDTEFKGSVKAYAGVKIIAGETTYEAEKKIYTIDHVGGYFYTISNGTEIIGAAYKDIISATDGSTGTYSKSFEYAAQEAYAKGSTSFEADGKTYKLDDNLIFEGETEFAFISVYSINSLADDVKLTREFKEQLISALEGFNTAEKDGEGRAAFVMKNWIDGKEQEFRFKYNPEKNMYEIVQYSYSELLDIYGAPSKEHWLGTDGNGMDMLTRLMYGGRVSLVIGFIVEFISTTLGVILGGISGYFGGWVDNLIMRIVDILYCIPSTPLLIILGATMDEYKVDPKIRMLYLMLVLGFLGWPGVARLVRGQILSLREQEFMTATEACGLSISHRIFKHLIPNVIPQLIVTCTMGLGSVIITESTLSFLGLGVRFPFASWGNIISDVTNTFVLTNYWYVWIPAGIALLLTVLAFNLVGDGLRDAFDPRMKR